jgi:hypothetical protein
MYLATTSSTAENTILLRQKVASKILPMTFLKRVFFLLRLTEGQKLF